MYLHHHCGSREPPYKDPSRRLLSPKDASDSWWILPYDMIKGSPVQKLTSEVLCLYIHKGLPMCYHTGVGNRSRRKPKLTSSARVFYSFTTQNYHGRQCITK